VIARAGALALALAVGLGGTALAGRLPAGATATAATAATAPAVRLELPAALPMLVCPGPETAVVPDGASALPVPGPYTVTAAVAGSGSEGAALGPLAGAAATDLAGGGVRVLARAGDPGGALRLVPATSPGAAADTPVRLAAVQATLARAGDLRGLTVGACGAATADAWLVGGDAIPGRRTRLLLANPTPAPAVVDVRVAGPDGPVAARSGRGLVLAPGRVRAVLLDALVPGTGPLAVHVVARTGRFTALMHDTALRGAVPAGTDDVVPTSAPARRVVVPGVVVLPGGSARLRVAAAGTAEAVVRVRVVGPAGEVTAPAAGVLSVPAGGVVELALPWLAPGAYAVVLDADTPVVAGAVLSVTGPRRGPLRAAVKDLAWTTATAPLMGRVAGAVPRPVELQGARTTRPATRSELLFTAGRAPADVELREVDVQGAACTCPPCASPPGGP
jgi:hypothetical protein